MTPRSIVEQGGPGHAARAHPAADDAEELLRSDPELAAAVANAERLRLQVLIAVPRPDGSLIRRGFRVDREYFYPASSVKLCAAFGALEKLGELRSEDRVTPRTGVRFVFGEGRGRGRRSLNTTIRSDIERAIVVSDNDAFNRLLDFVGTEELAERLSRHGLVSASITHHLGDSSEGTPRIELLLPTGGTALVSQRTGFPIPAHPPVTLGRAYRDERGRLVEEPMSFATKNAIPLRELQDMLVGVVRPDLTAHPAQWDIPFRSVLVDILDRRPSDLDPRRIPRGGKLDAQYRPLSVAIEAALPELDARVYGKGGRAFGFAVENAYVESEKTGRAFFVTATLYANGNDVLNDDRYEYDTVATPFLTRLVVVLARQFLPSDVASPPI